MLKSVQILKVQSSLFWTELILSLIWKLYFKKLILHLLTSDWLCIVSIQVNYCTFVHALEYGFWQLHSLNMNAARNLPSARKGLSLPAHPRLVLVTKRLRACSLSGSPISLSVAIILKPNTSPHLHLDFIEKFSCLKFKTVEIFIIITESIVIQSSTKAMYCWIRNTQQHAQPWIQVQTVYLVHQNYILVDKNHSTDTLRDHARKKIKLMSMIVLLLKSLILVKKLSTDEFRKTLKASTYWHIN